MASSNEAVSRLGFGFMRLPETGEEDNKRIDIEQVKSMVDAFMDAGFTYFDTARAYHDGRSEAALREALVERYPRTSYTVATKLPAWLANSEEHARSMFDKSLHELGVEYFDYFLLHNLGEDRTQLFDNWGLWDFLAQKKEEGLIRNLGFSLHDKAEVLEELLNAHPTMDFVQLQINYADWESETIESRKCYEVARAHNLPIVVMEPIKGGSLLKLPTAAQEVLHKADPDATLPSWALRFPASLPGVISVLSGMTTLDQVAQNIEILGDGFQPMTAPELDTLAQTRALLSNIPTVPCTDCRYCVKSCPEGVRIPAVLMSLNILALYNDEHRAMENYGWNASAGPASACIACGVCEGVCPQHIHIIDELERAASLFE